MYLIKWTTVFCMHWLYYIYIYIYTHTHWGDKSHGIAKCKFTKGDSIA